MAVYRMFNGLAFIQFCWNTLLLFLSLLFILLCSQVIFASEIHYSVTKISSSFNYIQDKQRELTIQSAISQFEQGKYTEIKGNNFNIGNSDDLYWLMITLVNNTPKNEQQKLIFGSPFVPLLNGYLLTESGKTKTIIKHSKNQAFRNRNNAYVMLNSSSFTIKAHNSTQILIQYQPRGMSFLPVSLETESSFSEMVSVNSVKASIFYSFSLATIISFFLFGLAVRKSVVLCYAALFLQSVFFIAIIEGYGFKFIWPDWPQWNMIASLVMGLILSSSGFALSAISVEKVLFYRCFKLACYGMSVISLLFLFLIPYSDNVMMMSIINVLLALMVVTQAYSIYSWLTKSFTRHLTVFITVMLITFILSYLSIQFFESQKIPEWMFLSANRSLYLMISLAAMITVTLHIAGLRNDHEKALKREIETVKNEATMSQALYEAEKKYSQARELAVFHQRQLATASHDIRQPLTSIRATVDSIAQQQQPAIRKQLSDAFEYIEQLCTNYLTTTRPPVNQPDTLEVYPVNMILNSISRMFEQEAVAKDLQFHVIPCSVQINATPMLIIRILSNFVANAIKHTDQGRIVIGCRRYANFVQINIYDTGRGISQKDLNTIFEPYYKNESSRGEGLGLAIVKQLAGSKDWDISVDSVLGKGSRFSISVPVK